MVITFYPAALLGREIKMDIPVTVIWRHQIGGNKKLKLGDSKNYTKWLK